MPQGRNRLRFVFVCGARRSQAPSGNLPSRPLRIDAKWVLCVCVALLAGFLLWLAGGAVLCFDPRFSMASISSLDVSLSSLCKTGWNPLCCGITQHSSHALISVLGFLFLMGTAQIASVSWSSGMKRHLCPQSDVTRKSGQFGPCLLCP